MTKENPWLKYVDCPKQNQYFNCKEIAEMWDYYWGKKEAPKEIDLDAKKYKELEI